MAAQDVGLDESQDMSKILILNAKLFKTRFGFQFCWAKNRTIFLCRSEDLKVRCPDDLSRSIQNEQEALS